MPRSVNSVQPRQEGKSIKTSQRLLRKKKKRTYCSKNVVEKVYSKNRDKKKRETLEHFDK